jgi:hypothetical protein
VTPSTAPFPTQATPPEEQNVPARVLELRATAVRLACRDARSVDVLMWAGGAALVGTGVGVAIAGLTPSMTSRSHAGWYAAGIGPGLALGGIGLPFARGLIKEADPLDHACETVLRHWPAQPADLVDIEVAERLLFAAGQPSTAVLPVLLGVATALVAGFTVGTFLFEADELTQVAGGISAAVVTGWLLLPYTPRRRAAVRFTQGAYAPEPIVLTPVAFTPPGGGFGAGIGGTF